MALGNVCMTKQRKEMGVQTLQYVFFLEKQNKTETGTKAKRKIQNNETKPRVDKYYGKVTRTFLVHFVTPCGANDGWKTPRGRLKADGPGGERGNGNPEWKRHCTRFRPAHAAQPRSRSAPGAAG